jgi:hypothetical protein
MNENLKYPLDIQLFAEGGSGGEGGNTGTQAGAQVTATQQIDYDKLAEVVSKRAAGTEDKVLQGYFKQQGLSAEQATEAINQYKLAQATKQQEEAQRIQSMKQENEKLKTQILNSQIDTKVAELASTLGVQIDKVPFLNKLVDRSNATKEDGTLNDENIKAAIETVLKAFPDFKSTTQVGGFQQIGGGNQGGAGGNGVDDQLDGIFGVKKK